MVDPVSPLAQSAIPGRYGCFNHQDEATGIRIGHRICVSLVQVTAWPDTLQTVKRALKKQTGLTLKPGNNSPSNEQYAIMPIAPGRFLVEAMTTDLETGLREMIAPDAGAVTGVSNARVVVSITGKKVEWVLSKGIAVDFSLTAFPVATCIQTSHHQIGLTIRRIDEQGFELYVFSSFVRSFWQWLESAAAEVGYEVV
jgi:sarcosine oxidase subunit gamma